MLEFTAYAKRPDYASLLQYPLLSDANLDSGLVHFRPGSLGVSIGVAGALAAVVAAASLFFVLIPGIGAFIARGRWRHFRQRMIDASLLPVVGYEEMSGRRAEFLGYFRFIGHLEAIQGDDIVWLHSGNLSVSAELRTVSVYTLPSVSYVDAEGLVERNEETVGDEMPRRVPWKRITALPSGTQVFVSGALYTAHGQGVFRSERKAPLMVVIFDGGEDTLLRRSVWAGRQRNEYWNRFTPISLIAGSLVLMLLSYNLFRQPVLRMPATVGLVLSLSPIIPFLPPGILPFFAYRFLWRRGRLCRAERDILQLPLRYFAEGAGYSDSEVRLPGGETYTVRQLSDSEEAFSVMEGGKIRRSSILDGGGGKPRVFHLFGRAEGEGSQRRMVQPKDPMAELVLIPGDPTELARLCERRARIDEVLAALSFGISYLANGMLAFVLFALWLR